MSRVGPLRCVLIGEDEAHWRIADSWTRRVLQTAIPWIAALEWNAVLEWYSNEGRPYCKHGDIVREKKRGRGLRLRLGRLLNEMRDARKAAEGVQCLRNLAWVELLAPRTDVVYFARDVDGKPERHDALDYARAHRAWPFAIVGMMCQPESEAWFVAGFVPGDERERAQLATVMKQLRFDPTQQPHKLTSTVHGGPRDAKKVLALLIKRDPARRADCLEVPLARLRLVGAESGINRFLDEVEREVAPRV